MRKNFFFCKSFIYKHLPPPDSKKKNDLLFAENVLYYG